MKHFCQTTSCIAYWKRDIKWAGECEIYHASFSMLEFTQSCVFWNNSTSVLKMRNELIWWLWNANAKQDAMSVDIPNLIKCDFLQFLPRSVCRALIFHLPYFHVSNSALFLHSTFILAFYRDIVFTLSVGKYSFIHCWHYQNNSWKKLLWSSKWVSN